MSAGPPQISFIDYDQRYAAACARLAEQVHAVLPDVGLDHVGSTAVPGLGGRGVLDVVVVSPSTEVDRVVAALHGLGWADSPFAWIKPMLTATVEGDGVTFPVLAYVLDAGHHLRRGLLVTRDCLRADPYEAARYAAVKRAAIAAGHSSPWAYQQAKTPYLQDLAARRATDTGAAVGSPGSSPDGLDPLAVTACWTAAERARESARPDRLFTDPLADLLAGEHGRALAEQMRAGTPDNPVIAVRTRYFDDVLTDVLIHRRSISQAIVLAAGMDTRAFRLDLPQDLVWFELDRVELLTLKDRELSAAAALPRCDRRSVATDLTGDWPADLRAAGFRQDRPTIWLVEGLLVYLQATAVNRLLDQVSGLSAPGSELLCDPAGQSLLDSPWMRPWLDRLDAAGMTWRFGTDRPEDLLIPRGWRPTATLFSTVGTELGRWPFPQYPRGTPGIPQSFLVHARR